MLEARELYDISPQWGTPDSWNYSQPSTTASFIAWVALVCWIPQIKLNLTKMTTKIPKRARCGKRCSSCKKYKVKNEKAVLYFACDMGSWYLLIGCSILNAGSRKPAQKFLLNVANTMAWNWSWNNTLVRLIRERAVGNTWADGCCASLAFSTLSASSAYYVAWRKYTLVKFSSNEQSYVLILCHL